MILFTLLLESFNYTIERYLNENLHKNENKNYIIDIILESNECLKGQKKNIVKNFINC